LRKGDKDVKKEIKKTIAVVLDFLEKKIIAEILKIKRSQFPKLH
jgi:hypothetical protein